MNDFVIHACEQILRFSSVDKWSDLSEERKLQLSFNMGVVALSLNLNKEESYKSIMSASRGKISMGELHNHFRTLITSRRIIINEDNATKSF